MRRIPMFALALTVAAGLSALAGQLSAQEQAVDTPAGAKPFNPRAAAPTGRVMIVPAPALVGPMAVVNDRNGRFSITVAVTRFTPGVIPDHCTATIVNADLSINEFAIGAATLINGSIYRCHLTLNYMWNGIDDALPVRVDVAANGADLTYSAATYWRDSNQTKTIPVPADGAVTNLSFALRL